MIMVELNKLKILVNRIKPVYLFIMKIFSRNKNVIKSVRSIINIKKSEETINNFCIKKYEKKFGKIYYELGYHTYKNFEIISENEIKINYSYGIKDRIFEDNFIVKI